MINNLKRRIKNNLFNYNTSKKKLIRYKMMNDAINSDIGNQSFDNYINKIYTYYVVYFLQKDRLSSQSSSLIQKSNFNRHKNNFFINCTEYENKIISNDLSKFANKFLDIQATKEKEQKCNVEIVNKRNYNDFINTTTKFLIHNFDVFATKFYIYFVNTNILDSLSDNFQQEFNIIVEELMSKFDTQNLIIECFNKKFIDFESRINKQLKFGTKFNANNYSLQTNEDFENESWMDVKKTVL